MTSVASACEPESEQDTEPHPQAAAVAKQTDADGDVIGVDAASKKPAVASAASPIRWDAVLKPVSSARSAEAADDISDDVSTMSTLTQDSNSESGMVAAVASAVLSQPI